MAEFEPTTEAVEAVRDYLRRELDGIRLHDYEWLNLSRDAIAAFVEAEGLKEVSAEQWDWHGSQGTKRLVGPWRKRD